MALDDDLLTLERQVLADAAGDLFTAVDELRQMLAEGAPGIRQRLARIAITDFDNIIRNGIFTAHDLGAAQALADAALAPDVDPNALAAAQRALSAAPLGEVVAPVAGIAADTAAGVGASLTLISVGSPADEALGPVFQAANRVKGVVTSQVNLAANRAVTVVADKVSSPLVWQAERDACVYCLGLAGKVVSPGEVFPDADQYAEVPKAYGSILEPPRHPNCRCTLAVLFDPEYAVALEREAQRSILRGFSLRSESQAVRIRAAKRLLERNPDAPKSVIAYARRAVKAGRFPDGRDVPGGSPRLIVNG